MLNKVLPDYLRDPEGAAVAETMKDRASEVADRLSADLSAAAPLLGDPDQIARVLNEIADSYLNFQLVALREKEERATLAVTPDVLAAVPFFDTDIYDLAGLVRLGEQIWD